jgi:cytochrome P450
MFGERRIMLILLALRLYPITLSSRREAIRDTVLPTGGGEDGQSHILVKKGWTVMTNIHALHRRKDIYGDDAEDFKPERWESLRQNWHYVPFSGGPRICPAQQLALTEASYTMYRLLLKFKENRSCDDRPWTENIKVTVSNKNGVSISLIPA